MRLRTMLGLTCAGIAAQFAIAAPAAPALAREDGGKSSAAATMVGAAKVDITPPAAERTPGVSVRDPLTARVIYVGNGQSCAILGGLDLIWMTAATADVATAAMARTSGCAVENILLSVTHTHSSGALQPDAKAEARLIGNLADAAARAKTAARPATVTFGTGTLDLNINRDLFRDGRWMVGPNLQGSSDKSLAVIAFRDAEARPIAAYVNYAMHPVNFNRVPVISADFAGEASRYIERRFGADMVAVFAQGASGDQNPRLLQPLNVLRGEIWAVPAMRDTRLTAPEGGLFIATEHSGSARYERKAPATIPKDREAAYRAAFANVDELVRAEGAILGETAISVMRFDSSAPEGATSIAARRAETSCPARDIVDRAATALMGEAPEYTDAGMVPIRLTALRIGSILIAGVGGEVYSAIGRRLKATSPSRRIMLTTLANGMTGTGYIYSDEAAGSLTFTVTGSRLRPGCAEGRITTGLDALMRDLEAPPTQ